MRLSLALLLLTGAMPSAQAEIMIGVAGPMTGQYASFGVELKTGAEAAISAINAAGGINGEQLSLLISDDACDTKRATDVAKEFIAKDVRLVAGHFCSGASSAAALIYRDAGVLMVTPAASAPALTDAGNWNVFRTSGRDDAQADLAAARMAGSTPTSPVAIISDGQALSEAMSKRFRDRLPQALALQVKPGQADFADTSQTILEKQPASLYLAISASDAGRLVAALRTAGVTGAIYGPDFALSDEFFLKAQAAGENARFTFPQDASTLPASRNVVDALTAALLPTDGAVLPTYAAVQVFAAAAAASSVNDSKAMADWLRAGNPVKTVLGEISFDAKGDLKSQPFTWYRLSNGTFLPDETLN